MEGKGKLKWRMWNGGLLAHGALLTYEINQGGFLFVQERSYSEFPGRELTRYRWAGIKGARRVCLGVQKASLIEERCLRAVSLGTEEQLLHALKSHGMEASS